MSELFGNTSSAVRSQRQATSADELDFYPTPPWATRAVLPYLRDIDPALDQSVIWEPACGQGHMAVPLSECGAYVFGSDLFAHERRASVEEVMSFRGGGFAPPMDFLGDPAAKIRADWVITNPPFNLALEFALRGLEVTRSGVALLVRSNWAECVERYQRLFSVNPPRAVLQYCERVPMTKGRWDPDASTATAYAWFIWTKTPVSYSRLGWIPPGQRQAHHRQSDVDLFCTPPVLPLFDGSAA